MQSCDDIDSFVMDVERQIRTELVDNDLASGNSLTKELQNLKEMLEARHKKLLMAEKVQ